MKDIKHSSTRTQTAEASDGGMKLRELQDFLELERRLKVEAAALGYEIILIDLHPQEWIDKQNRRFKKFRRDIFLMIWGKDLKKACKALWDFDFDGERLKADEIFGLLRRPLRDFIGVLAPEGRAHSPLKDKAATASDPRE